MQLQGASELATKLILTLAGGTAGESTLQAGAAPKLVGEVKLDEARAHRLLGIPDLKVDEAHGILEKLGLQKRSASAEQSTWSIPSYRIDLQRSVDLVEDIARVHVRSPSGEMVPIGAFAEADYTVGPMSLQRYNNLRSVTINGNPAPGVASGTALLAMEETAAATLPASIARRSASPSTNSPRAQFTMRTPCFISPSVASLIMPCVSCVSATCSVT